MEIAGESTFIHEETPSKRKGTSDSVGDDSLGAPPRKDRIVKSQYRCTCVNTVVSQPFSSSDSMNCDQRAFAVLAGVELGTWHMATTAVASDNYRPTHRKFQVR